MAKDGEFPVGETPSPTKGQLRSSRFGCEKKGALTREHFDPVAAFAQEHLLAGDDGDVHVSFAMGSRKPQLEDGVNIVVEPRSSVGELRVVHVGPPFYASGTRWAETGYCLHVVKHGRGTTVVVQKSWATIK